MKLHVLLWITVFVLVGCGGVGEPPEPTSLLIITPLPTTTIVGDCDDVARFENWIQVLVFNQVEFEELLKIAQTISRNELHRNTRALNRVAYTVASTPILSCGEDAYTKTTFAMQYLLTKMAAYVNAERHDLATIIADAQAYFDIAKSAQDLLIVQLDAMYQQQAISPTP